MVRPGKRSGGPVAVVLLLVLLVADMAPLCTATARAPPAMAPQREIVNDKATGTVGSPAYYASLLSMSGYGSPSGRFGDLIPIDMDGDGLPELATMTGQAFIEVLEAKSQKIIWRSPQLPYGAHSLVAGDIDGDGHDELVAGDGVGQVHVFSRANLKDPNSPALVVGSLPLQTSVLAVAMADFDDDGRQDVVCAQAGTYNLTYLRNSLAADGKTIELTANISSDMNTYAFSNSQVTFLKTAPMTPAGDVQIIAVFADEHDYWTILRLKRENFQVLRSYSYNDYPPHTVQILEIDNDTDPEVVLNRGLAISVLNGTTFYEDWFITLNGWWTDTFAIDDYNGDGLLDLLQLEWGTTNKFYLQLFNITNRTYYFTEWLNWSEYPIGLATGDFDGDLGLPEVAMTFLANITVMTLAPAAGHNYTIESVWRNVGYEAYGLDGLDWDDDGTTEVISGSNQGLISAIDPTTGSIENQRYRSPFSQGSVSVADLDMDGQPDVLTGSLRNLTLLDKNLTIKALTDLRNYTIDEWNPTQRPVLAAGDIDHDGAPEALLGTDVGYVVALNGTNLSFEQSGSGNSGKDKAIIAPDIDGDGYPEIVAGDTLGQVSIFAGPEMLAVAIRFVDFGPYGLAASDVNGDGRVEIIVGTYNGLVRYLSTPNLTTLMTSADLGDQAWGITCADADGDGRQEVLVGMGDGHLMALNMTDLSVEWDVDLGEWTGAYGSMLVRDLDQDGNLEVAVGSDGYVYTLRLLKVSQKPDISLGPLTVPDPVMDDREVQVSVPVSLSGPIPSLNVTVDIRVEPMGSSIFPVKEIGSAVVTVGSKPVTVSMNWTPSNGTWLVVAEADPDNKYSEKDEWNNRAEASVKAVSAFTQLEWFAGQGTNLGRYHGLQVADTNNDGRLELIVGTTEGFVQSYSVQQATNDTGHDDVSASAMSDDLGSSAFGIAIGDLDRDGSPDTVISTGDGWVYAFEGIGGDFEWKAKVSDGPCYGILAGDVDIDGKLEAVVGCSDGRVHVLNGLDGRSEGGTMLLFEVYALATADIGEDGRPDLIAAAQDGTVYVISSKTLATEASFRLGDVYVDDLAVGDVDHDGGTEIVYGDRSGEVRVVGTTPNASLPLGWALELECSVDTGSAVRGLGLADVSRDPGPELVVGSIEGVSAYRSVAGGLEPIGDIDVGGGLTGFALGDLDRDAFVEAAVGTVTGNLTLLGMDAAYLGNSTSIDFIVKSHLPGLGAGLYGTAYGDLDMDGAPELLLGTETGDLRVYDGISKDMEAHITGLGASLYGLKVADVDGDKTPEIVTGSGDKRACAYDYDRGKLTKLWCSDDLGDWTVALQVLDANRDGRTEVAVGSGSKVYLMNGTTGRIMNSTFDLGPHIISLAAGELDGDPWPELVAGTELGYLPVLNANNMSLAWGVTLDSWPVGLAMADNDGNGIDDIYAGTNSAVYSISYIDHEVIWQTDLGQPAWGIAVTDLQADGRDMVFAGLKDGRLMALDSATGRTVWYSWSLGGRAGWYNSIRAGDMDVDSQQELLVGSSGFLYLFGAGNVTPRPEPDAVLESMTMQDQELADGQVTNLTATVYDHSLAPMANLGIHLFIDDVYADSAVIQYIEGLGRVTVKFPYTARAGTHNLSVIVDRYNAIHEYNEMNNEMTITVIVLGSMNLAIDGGVKGVRFSDPPVKGVEVTVFADIRNTGEEVSSAKIKFYWANLRLFGEDTVHTRGQEKVTAAVNWTPPSSGDWDVTVVIEPEGFDSRKDDNVATRSVHIMTPASVGVASVKPPQDLTEEVAYSVPVMIANTGEAATTGRLALYLDGNLSWSSGKLLLPPGGLQVDASVNASAGFHTLRVALLDLGMDDRGDDNEASMNITVRTRPDIMFDAVTPPTDKMLVAGKQLYIGLLIANRGGSNATFMLRAYDNDQIFFEKEVRLDAGTSRTIQVPWNVTKGDHNLEFRADGTVPVEYKTGNNVARQSLYIPDRKTESTNWPMVSLLFVGILAPLIAALAYYSQVQPVREAARVAREAKKSPPKKIVKKAKKGG